jgi:hypothetical protein
VRVGKFCLQRASFFQEECSTWRSAIIFGADPKGKPKASESQCKDCQRAGADLEPAFVDAKAGETCHPQHRVGVAIVQFAKRNSGCSRCSKCSLFSLPLFP